MEVGPLTTENIIEKMMVKEENRKTIQRFISGILKEKNGQEKRLRIEREGEEIGGEEGEEEEEEDEEAFLTAEKLASEEEEEKWAEA